MRNTKIINNDCVTEYFRCDRQYVRIAVQEPSSSSRDGLRPGDQAKYTGHLGDNPATLPSSLFDALASVEIHDGVAMLPFDPEEVIRNLRCEEYIGDWRQNRSTAVLAQLYYSLRPLLPVGVRRYLQKVHLRNWKKVPFPRWPVDTSVDSLQAELIKLCLRSRGAAAQIPFIWFWPAGASSCAIMTHDVETARGRDHCDKLMDIDDSFGVKASFQVIPEERYSVTPEFLNSIRDRGFEVVVHDLNHDGHLYRDRNEFLRRVAKINSYGKAYEAEGFRAGVLYRKQAWYDDFDFAFDMSVPNVAHLDPQRGGCCTVMPYFVGKILELPVTTTQDYTLFNILEDYSLDLWKQQTSLIMAKHGLMSFIIHPDYVVQSRERRVFEALLGHIASLRDNAGVWVATPGEVNRWWRQRAGMKILGDQSSLRIEGEGANRARIAYASEKDGRLVVDVPLVGEEQPVVQRL